MLRPTSLYLINNLYKEQTYYYIAPSVLIRTAPTYIIQHNVILQLHVLLTHLGLTHLYHMTDTHRFILLNYTHLYYLTGMTNMPVSHDLIQSYTTVEFWTGLDNKVFEALAQIVYSRNCIFFTH